MKQLTLFLVAAAASLGAAGVAEPIATDDPHVKVAWRVAGRPPQPQSKERR
jgi:hypothetical protein